MQTLIGNELIDDLGIDYFKDCSTFGGLTDNAIRYLFEQGEVLQLETGDRLYEFADSGDCFYVILKGTIQFISLHEGEVNYIRDHSFGEQLGFIAMIALHNRIGNAHAVKDSIVLKVSSAVFYDLHETLPTDFGILLLNLSREMARQLGQYVLLPHPRINVTQETNGK